VLVVGAEKMFKHISGRPSNLSHFQLWIYKLEN
jgi:hypothetical protein